jgi:parallel beta-helix repeat protein
MKKIFGILLFCISYTVSATDYYISATGNDAANGLSESTAWKTIAKFNSSFSGLIPGDRIFFRRGDIFYGTLTISRSGTAANPITIGAYGSGVDPIIYGFNTVSTWSNEGNGIYSSPVTCQSSPNIVTVNGVNTPMGRYPNTGYLTYESHSGTTSITDNQLPATPNWTGAEIVIRKNAWVLDRNLVTNHNTHTLSYTALGYAFSIITDGFGYFIQNDIKTLDILGDWYYGGGKIYMYFGSADPASNVVKVSSLDQLMGLSGRSYITIDHITFEGANKCGVNVTNNSNHVILQNCSINFSGTWALNVQSYCTYFIFDNCSINYTNDTGVLIRDGSDYATITNSLIQNTATIVGTFSTWGARAIDMTSNNSLVQYNKIINTGYNGMQWYGTNASVKNNLIDNFCIMMDDGAGIYTTGLETGRVISGNIILNGKGNPEGTTNPNYYPAEGIYLDEPCANVLVDKNTVAYCAHDGIKLHEAHNNTITNNTCFSNKYQIEYCGSGAQPSHPINNNSVNNNIFFAKNPDQSTLSYLTSSGGGDAGIHPGTSNNNFYARPISDDKTFNIYQDGVDLWPGSPYSLTQWRSMSGQDANSQKSPIPITDINVIRFEYNATGSNKTINLVGNFIDVKGINYPGNITLLPYCSAVLLPGSLLDVPRSLQTNSKQTHEINIYPNPANSLLNISIQGSLTIRKVTIIDYSGRKLIEESINSKESSVDISSLSSGKYILIFDCPGYSIPGRFVKN